MNKTVFVKLGIGSALLVVLVLSAWPDRKPRPPAKTPREPVALATGTQVDANTPQDMGDAPATPVARAEKPAAQENNVTDSREPGFNQRCTEILDQAVESMDLSSILPQDQARLTRVFNDCIYAIDLELAQTEKQFTRSAETAACFRSVYAIRDYLLELGTDVQSFAELPNNTDSDQVAIAEAFTRIRDDIMTNGETAMMNRSMYCSPDTAADDRRQE